MALADNIVTGGSVDANLAGRRSADYRTVAIRWTGACQGAATGSVAFDGDITMIDAATGERIYVGGVVDTSGNRSVSGRREWAVLSAERERLLFPELKLNCYEQFPLHGGREVLVTGGAVLIPPRFGGNGGPGGANGDYGTGDPTAPAGAGGCRVALVGTPRADRLVGGGGDVVFGLATSCAARRAPTGSPEVAATTRSSAAPA